MKAIEILNTYEALATLVEKDLELNTACGIAQNIQALAIPRQLIEQNRTKLIQDYGKKDENNQLIINESGEVTLTDTESFHKKFNELMESHVDIELVKIKKSALKDIKISPKTALGFMHILEGK